VTGHLPGGQWGPPRAIVVGDGTAEDGVTGPGGTFAVRPDASAVIRVGRVDDSGATVGPVASLDAATSSRRPSP